MLLQTTPQPKNSLNNSDGQCHLITLHQFWEGQAYKNCMAPQSAYVLEGTLFSSTARVGFQPKDQPNHCATGLEYSGPISEVVTLDDPADVTLLYEEPFLVDFGWSSSSLCLSGAAAGS